MTLVNDSINVVLGVTVLLSYVITLPPAMQTMSANYLWAGIIGTSRSLTIVSMFITAIAYLYTYYYLRTESSMIVTIGFLLFLIGATLWAPMLTLNKKFLTLGALTMTSIGILVLLIFIFLKFDSLPLKIAIVYVFFHVFVLDNLHWGYKFYNIYDPTILAQMTGTVKMNG